MNPKPYGTDKSVAIYYVVPTCLETSSIDKATEHVQACKYYTYTQKESWHPVDPKQIGANQQSNYVCLVQITDIKGGPAGVTLETDVRLYGAVAKTLTGNDDGPITDLFLANFAEQQPTVMIPVAPGCTRGLILIFTVTGEKGKASPGLRATFDPEIKGST